MSDSVFESYQTRDKETLAAVLAKMATCIDPNIDETESFEIAFDFLREADLNVINVVDLVALFRCTCYNPKHDILH